MSGRAEVKREKRAEEEEEGEQLWVIEKPVAHPDRRFISRARSTLLGLLSYYLALLPSRRLLLSIFFSFSLSLSLSPACPSFFFLALLLRLSFALLFSSRQNKDEKKPREGKEGRESRCLDEVSRREEWKGEEWRTWRERTAMGRGGDGRDEEEKRSYTTMPAEVHSRTITDARRGLNEWLRKPWAL